MSVTRLVRISYQFLSAGLSPLRITGLVAAPRSSFHFPPLSRTLARPRWQVIISSTIVPGRGCRRRRTAKPRTSASPPSAAAAAAAAQMTTESGRQRAVAVARRKLNRDYRLVSCPAIIRPARHGPPLGSARPSAGRTRKPRQGPARPATWSAVNDTTTTTSRPHTVATAAARWRMRRYFWWAARRRR